MIDRNRSLIHILMAGLVGLTLGLFVGWWVWPVQWVEPTATAPASVPAASAPAQSVESPAEDNRNSDSSYSALLDWVNQGLLYVAAALLLVGGVVIGYQLLRQSQGKDSKEPPFPLPFSRSRSNQATARREPRTKSPPLAGRPVRPRQPTLNWLRKETESESPADTEEPVFKEQFVADRPPSERSPESLRPDSETSQQRYQGVEAEDSSNQRDYTLSPETWTDREAGGSIAPQELPVEAERGPGSPVSYGAPEMEIPAIQGGEDRQDGAPVIERDGEDLSQLEPAADEDAERRGDVLQTSVEPADFEDEGFVESRDSEAQELRDDDWQTAPPETTFSEVLDRPEAGAGVDTDVLSEDFADRVGADERKEQGMESPPFPIPRPETVETVRSQGEPGPATPTSRQLVGQFEANYAFGIQTYDESFTINAEDGELLGACGMGINESVDRTAANSDQVRLLDIWLYDRSAVRSVSQPLVSPGFDVSGLDAYAEDNGSDSSHPLEVGPGLTCTLRSDHIVLECTIKSATFLDSEQAPMPFRSVNASLAIYVQT